MRRTEFTVFVALSVLLLFSFSAVGQSSGSSVYKGSVVDGSVGYFEVAGKARIDVDKYLAKSGDGILVNATNLFAEEKRFTFSVQVDDLNVDYFGIENGSEPVAVGVFNWTSQSVVHPNGTVESSWVKVNESVVFVEQKTYQPLQYRVFEFDGRTWAGFDFIGKSGAVGRLKLVLSTNILGGRVKYSYLLNSSGVYFDFDPVLDDGLVGYWDSSGTGSTSTDIYGDNDGAIGLNTMRDTETPLNGAYLRRLTQEQGDAVLTIRDEAFDAIGASGGEDWAFSFWMNTTDLTGGNPPNFIVGKECNHAGCTQASPFTINTGNESTANGNLQWKGYPATRNDVDNTLLAQQGWHHVLLTANSSGAFYYINSKPEGNKPLNAGSGSTSNAANVSFGCNTAITANGTTCADSFAISNINLDEIAFWNRSFDQNDVAMLYYNGTNGTFCTGDPCSFSGGGDNSSNVTLDNETTGDYAIETAINSSVPSARQYKTQKVYVVNLTNAQWYGRVDYLVVQDNPPKRWLLNYITANESYLNAQNISSVVYVLEIANKTKDDITQEVSALINSTKG